MQPSASSTKSDFDQAVQRMLSNWESSVRDAGIAREKKAELRRIYDRVGAGRFCAGVEAALHNHRTGFFPTVDQFEGFIPAVAGYTERETCEFCTETASGWSGYRKQSCTRGGMPYMAYKRCDHGVRQ